MNSDKVVRIPPPTKRLVVRKANSHRDLRPLTERATLEKVLGLTVSKNAALACDPVSGIIAYPAGCVVVLFNPRKNKQSFVVNASKKTITSLAFSGDGKYLATGESGHMPSVRIWDMEDHSHPQVAEMTKGHKFGVACVAFSPNLKYVASVGFQHDMIVNIWNWKTSTKVASNKVSSKVSALSFSENGSYFVTVGVRHVKFWYFDTESNKSKVSKTLVINGRAALLGEQRNNTFYDVACGLGLNSDITYCVTSSGLLCSINSKRVLDTWVELKTSKAHAIAVSEHYIVCGCADGIIRVFNPLKLQHIVTLPKPHFLGVNIAEGIDFSNPLSKPEKAAYPDTVAVALDTVNHRLTCVYNDHSLYTWDVKDMKRIGKTWSSLYHSTCVWGVEVYPSVPDNRQAALPPGSFLTCSSDDTIRVWNIEDGTSVLFERNVYSKEMMRIIYTDETVANLKDTDISPALKSMRDSTSDSRNSGVRCLRISPDGQTLAAGDRSGNVRVYDLMFYDETAKIEAHESEVLCVEFSPNESGHKLLASAGRDRLIHVFDVQNNFSFVQTLDDHSASITSIKFNLSESDELQLLSCGADKSIIFRTAQQNPELQFIRTTNFVGKTTFYDMDVDVSRKYAATACQDRNVRVYDVNNGKQTKSYKGTPGDDGTLVRITLDSSGTYAATSCSDKSVCLTEFDTGECMASMSGHSEVVTGIKFSIDCKNLISVCGDGCVFVWKIPSTYTQNMVEKLQALGLEPEMKFQFGTPLRRDTYQVTHPSIPEETDFSPADLSAFSRPVREPSPPVNYRFSVGQLPAWAKKQLSTEDDKTKVSSEEDNTQQTAQPGGRWAQRIQVGGIHVAGEHGTLRPIAFPLNPADRKRYTIEPISLQEQVRALANSPLERRCSLTQGEDDDLFPLDGRAAFDGLTENNMEKNGTSEAPPGVRVSRGSDVMKHPPRKSSVVTLETGELKFEEAEEVEGLNEGEIKEVIIYLPPSQDDFDGEVASAPRVQEIVRHYEAVQLNHHPSLPNIAQPTSNGVQDDSSPDEPDQPVTDTPPNKNNSPGLYRSPSVDYLPSRLQTFLRTFQLSAAQQPKRLSLTVEDSKGEEQEENSKSKLGEKERITQLSEDSEDEVTSPAEDISKPFSEDENKPEGGDDEAIVGRYFETLGTSSPGSKSDEHVTEPPPLDTDRLMRTRLSISARFLSRSNQPGRNGSLPPRLDEETSRNDNSTSDDSKQDFQRRKEEMALAVEATRKRLEALGWKAKEDILKKLPTSSTTSSTENTAASAVNATATATSVSCTPTTTVMAASNVNKHTENTPVSSLAESSTKPTVITNLLETRMADVKNTKDTKEEEKEHAVKKEIAGHKKENQAKDEDGDKSKRSASHLISFFSQSKSSKNKDKEKENKEKEKEKSKAKDKEKGRSTPPPEKQVLEAKSTPGGKLERKGSTSSTASQKSEGKSWRKSLGILGGGSKHDKEEKQKKNTDHRTSTVAEGSHTGPSKEENSASRTVKETKDKSNKRQPERRSSTPTPEVLKKNSHAAPTTQENCTVKTVTENKEEKVNKKQPERRSSTPKTDLQTKSAQPTSNKKDESSLKTFKEEKEEKVIRKQSERRFSNQTEEPQTKEFLEGIAKQNEFYSLKTVKAEEGKISNKTEPNSGTRKTNENTSSFSENTVQLREKKGRLTSDERREKAKSLGDISKNLHKVEVSILDPTVPPSRTVDTMDIPNQLAHHSRRPMSSNAVLETLPLTTKHTPSDRTSLDAKNVHGVATLNDHLGVTDSLQDSGAESSLNGNLIEHKAALDTKSAPSTRSGDEEISALYPAPEKKSFDQDSSKVTFTAKNTWSGSGSSFRSDINELSAELSAAIASPPPQPIRLSMSESNLLNSGPSLGNRQSSVESICQEALENLGKAFQNVMDLHSKVLEEEPSQERHRLLSHISRTLSAMEEQIHESRVRRRQWELSYLPGGNSGAGSRPLSGMLSMSTGHLDQIASKGRSLRRHSEFSISSIPEVDTEVHEVLLETHFNKLFEMLSQKLSK